MVSVSIVVFVDFDRITSQLHSLSMMVHHLHNLLRTVYETTSMRFLFEAILSSREPSSIYDSEIKKWTSKPISRASKLVLIAPRHVSIVLMHV
jgi:hypothetical protein